MRCCHSGAGQRRDYGGQKRLSCAIPGGGQSAGLRRAGDTCLRGGYPRETRDRLHPSTWVVPSPRPISASPDRVMMYCRRGAVCQSLEVREIIKTCNQFHITSADTAAAIAETPRSG